MHRVLAFVATAALSVSFSGCTRIGGGSRAHPIDPAGHLARDPKTPEGLLVTGKEVEHLSSRYFGLVEVTFENPTAEWVRIGGVEVRFANAKQDAAVLVPWGTDLDAWAQSTLNRNDVRQASSYARLAFLGAFAATAAHVAPSSSARAAGGLVAAASLGALVGSAASSAAASAGEPLPFPPSHLLSWPISIPPGLFARRWIALNTRGDPDVGCVDSMGIAYETSTGKRERVWLRFRTSATVSAWQRGVCPSTR